MALRVLNFELMTIWPLFPSTTAVDQHCLQPHWPGKDPPNGEASRWLMGASQKLETMQQLYPIGSMYGIFTCICHHKIQANVCKPRKIYHTWILWVLWQQAKRSSLDFTGNSWEFGLTCSSTTNAHQWSNRAFIISTLGPAVFQPFLPTLHINSPFPQRFSQRHRNSRWRTWKFVALLSQLLVPIVMQEVFCQVEVLWLFKSSWNGRGGICRCSKDMCITVKAP